jgi:hypothetical protein
MDCRVRVATPYLPTFAPLLASGYKGAAKRVAAVGGSDPAPKD